MEPSKQDLADWSRAVLARGHGCCGCGTGGEGVAPRVIVPLQPGDPLLPENGMLMCSPCWLEFDRRFEPCGQTVRTSVVLDKGLYAEFQRQGFSLSKMVSRGIEATVRLAAAQSISQGSDG